MLGVSRGIRRGVVAKRRVASGPPAWITSLESSKGAFVLDFPNDRAWSTGTGVVSPIGALVGVTRTGTAYALTSANVLTSFAANTARRTDLGLLLEASSANTVAAPTNAMSWSLNGATISDLGNTNGPFQRVQCSGTENWQRLSATSSVSALNGVPVAVTAWYEPGTSGSIRIVCRNNGVGTESRVYGSPGNVETVDPSAGNITNVVNTTLSGGIRQVTFRFDSDSAASGDNHEFAIGPDVPVHGVSGNVIILGMQVEVGKTSASSLIPSQTTRPADVAAWGGTAATAATGAATRLGKTAGNTAIPVTSSTATPQGTYAARIAFFGSSLTSQEQTDWIAGTVPSFIASLPFMGGVALAGGDFGDSSIPGTMGTHYIYPSNASANYYLGKGMRLFRVPFLWERLQRTLNGALYEPDMTEIDRMVTHITGAGGYVLLDPHNYCRRRISGTTYIIGESGGTVTADHFADFWSRLADRYKANDKVMFGLVNEPFDQSTSILVTTQNTVIAAIRATSATNAIFATGNWWSGAHSWVASDNDTNMVNIVDSLNNFGFEAHQYLDSDSGGSSPICTVGSGASRLVGFTNWCRTNGKKAVLGEFNCGENSQCYTELEAMLDYMDANQDVWLGWTYWAGGPWWGDDDYSIEPNDLNSPVDEPQMTVLLPHIPTP